MVGRSLWPEVGAVRGVGSPSLCTVQYTVSQNTVSAVRASDG